MANEKDKKELTSNCLAPLPCGCGLSLISFECN